MFINKILTNPIKPNFKGYEYEKNKFGRDVMRFNFPHDEGQDCQLEIYKTEKNPTVYSGYKVQNPGTPVQRFKIEQGGTIVNLKDLGIKDNEAIAYRIVKNGQVAKETGMRIEGDYVLVARSGPIPLVRGSAVLVMPDNEYPGASFASYDSDNPLEIIINDEKQKEMEETVRTFSNQYGGNLAGLITDIKRYKELGTKILFSTPIMGADNKSHHHYWNKNNFQLADEMGSLNHYKYFIRELFKNGVVYVDDATLTSEGLEGARFNYAVKYGDADPQAQYLFNIDGLKNEYLSFGVIPKNKENLRHRVINPKSIYNEETGKIEPNRAYDKTKPTLFQIYDGSQVSEDQLSKLDQPIDFYHKIKSDDPIKINTYNDTLISYVAEIHPDEYENRLAVFIDFIKNEKNAFKLNSPEGTMLIGQFTNIAFKDDPLGGIGLWDANVDMVKALYGRSGYLDKLNKAITDPQQRKYIQELQRRAFIENKDTAVQIVRYRSLLARNVQTLYAAKTIGNAKTVSEINQLVATGKLSEEVAFDEETLKNVTKRFYAPLRLRLKDSKDDTTLKSIMELPMESLEFGDSVTEFMTRPFFAHKAMRDDTDIDSSNDKERSQVGLTRFELDKLENPQLSEIYAKNYLKVNRLFKNQVKDFAHQVLEKVNETSEEKIFDDKGNYTVYGEYVIELLGQDIARYAFLKSLAGENLRAKVIEDDIFYDTPHLRSITTLSALGIKSTNPVEIATEIHAIMDKNLTKLNKKDIDFVASAISKAIEGTNTTSFTIAEAMIEKAGLEPSYRFDAMKDVGDMDSVRSQDDDLRKSWFDVILLMSQICNSIKKVTPHAGTFAELTDFDTLFKISVGAEANPYNMPYLGAEFKDNKDAMMRLYNETGIATEAAYSYTFTDFLRILSKDFVEGYDGNINNIKDKLKNLVGNTNLEYQRNLYTFADNHDKPSVIHGMALDMDIFLSPLANEADTGDARTNAEKTRRNALARQYSMEILTNKYFTKDMPIEARLNVNNERYFQGVSSKAVAVAKLYRDIINEDLNGVANETERSLMKEALTCLVNGNYKGSGTNVKMDSIDHASLSSIEGALAEILKSAGIHLPHDDFYAVVNKANEHDMIMKHTVQNTPDFKQNRDFINNNTYGNNKKKPEELDSYVVSLSSLLLAAYGAVKGEGNEDYKKLQIAAIDFANKYDKKEVDKYRTPLPVKDSIALATRKDAFATRDFETSIKMVIDQAKYLASQRKDLADSHLFEGNTYDNILKTMFRSATEPAIQKTLMYVAFLQAFVGIPAVFMRDVLGALGFEEKTKNVHLQNRNAVVWTQLNNGPLKEYRTEIYDLFKTVMGTRNLDGARPLNHGTPYVIGTSNDNIPAVLRQDAKGDITISLFNALGINTNSRHNGYHNSQGNEVLTINKNNPRVPLPDRVELDYIELFDRDDNASALSLNKNFVFRNLFSTDNNTYKVQEFDGKYYIINSAAKLIRKEGRLISEGGKIVADAASSRFGTMILSSARKIAMRGRNHNENIHFNIAAEGYKQKEEIIEGQKLSLIAR